MKGHYKKQLVILGFLCVNFPEKNLRYGPFGTAGVVFLRRKDGRPRPCREFPLWGNTGKGCGLTAWIHLKATKIVFGGEGRHTRNNIEHLPRVGRFIVCGRMIPPPTPFLQRANVPLMGLGHHLVCGRGSGCRLWAIGQIILQCMIRVGKRVMRINDNRYLERKEEI